MQHNCKDYGVLLGEIRSGVDNNKDICLAIIRVHERGHETLRSEMRAMNAAINRLTPRKAGNGSKKVTAALVAVIVALIELIKYIIMRG